MDKTRTKKKDFLDSKNVKFLCGEDLIDDSIFFRLSIDNFWFFLSRNSNHLFKDELWFFQTLEGLFRFLEITKRHGLEIGGAFFPFFKKVGKHTILL